MDRAGDVLRGPERLHVGEVRVHFRRSFGARCVLEDHPHAVNGHLLDRVLDDDGRGNEAEVAGRDVLADRLVHMPERAGGQQHAVLEEQTPAHGVAGVDVLGDRVVHECDRRDDRDLAGAHVGLVDDAPHATKVVGVGMRVHDRDHRSLAELLVDELQRRPGGLLRGERIEDDPAGVALDEADVGEVEPTDLVDAGDDLVQAVGHVQDGLALQRGMDAVEVLPFQQEIVSAHVPGDVPGVGHDLLEARRSDEAAVVLREVVPVREGQRLSQLLLQRHGVPRRRLALWMEVPSIATLRATRRTREGKNQHREPVVHQSHVQPHFARSQSSSLR